MKGISIHWVSSDRFDTKPDKSTWIEVGDTLGDLGATVKIISSYRKQPYFPADKQLQMIYLKPLDLPLIYRLMFSITAFLWLRKHASVDDVVIINPHELWMKPMLSLAGFKRIHLDIRTLPIIQNSLKSKLDTMLFWRLVMKLFGQRCTSYSFITERLRGAVEQEFGFSYQDYVIWQSGVNTRFFSQLISMHRPESSTTRYTMFYHGSLYETRGVDRMLKAFSKLPAEYLDNCRLVVVGGGSGLKEQQALCQELNMDKYVEFRGLVPYEEIPLHISEADLCICPLPDLPEWNVSSPLKVLEYMACGKPIVLTRIPSHTDVLAEESFVLWTEGDEVEDFVKAFTQALDNLPALKEAADKAPEFVKSQWDWRAHGERLGAYLARHYG